MASLRRHGSICPASSRTPSFPRKRESRLSYVAKKGSGTPDQVRGDGLLLNDHFRGHAVGDEAVLMGTMVQMRDLFGRRLFVARECDSRAQRDIRHRHLAVVALLQHAFGL